MNHILEAAWDWGTFGDLEYLRDRERIAPILGHSQIYVTGDDNIPRLLCAGPQSAMRKVFGHKRTSDFVGQKQHLFKQDTLAVYQYVISSRKTYHDTQKVMVRLNDMLFLFKYDRVIVPFDFDGIGQNAVATFVDLQSKLHVASQIS